MPYINVKTNRPILEDQRKRLENGLGKAIELIPGKTEEWLMIAFEPETEMSFAGSENPTAFIEVKIFGSSDAKSYSDLTKEITRLVEKELDILPQRIYIQYTESILWGWNGENF